MAHGGLAKLWEVPWPFSVVPFWLMWCESLRCKLWVSKCLCSGIWSSKSLYCLKYRVGKLTVLQGSRSLPRSYVMTLRCWLERIRDWKAAKTIGFGSSALNLNTQEDKSYTEISSPQPYTLNTKEMVIRVAYQISRGKT